MSPSEVLHFAESELDRLSQDLISCGSSLAQSQAAIESVTEKLTRLREEMPAAGDREVVQHLQTILTKGKRLQALLDAGTSFHCESIFGKPEPAETTYNSDGTLDPNQDFRIAFQG